MDKRLRRWMERAIQVLRVSNGIAERYDFEHGPLEDFLEEGLKILRADDYNKEPVPGVSHVDGPLPFEYLHNLTK